MVLKHETGATGEGPRDASLTQEDKAEDDVSKADSESLLARACVALGIENEDVLSSRVYADRVVIVEGPVGYKRIWGIEQGRTDGD
jgi:hypothetical protein